MLVDLTAVCMVEGFSNPTWVMQADRVLKEIGKEKAREYFEVHNQRVLQQEAQIKQPHTVVGF